MVFVYDDEEASVFRIHYEENSTVVVKGTSGRNSIGIKEGQGLSV
jgi:hypothetical protein